MPNKRRSMEQIIEEQVQRWQLSHRQTPREEQGFRVFTVSREPGSGGRLVAQRVAKILGFDCFHQELIQAMAASAQVEARVLETLDEKGVNTLEHWIASLADRRHLWPDQHLNHLMRVMGAVSRHGKAVIVGRGSNFAVPPAHRLRIRVVAPLEERISRVSETFGVSREEARRRIMRTESERRAFVQRYFYADIADPIHYDMVVNTGELSVEAVASLVVSFAREAQAASESVVNKPLAATG